MTTKQNNDIYRGFDLKSITWGYRDIFQKTIDGLYEAKLLGDENRESTETFFKLLKGGAQKDHACFDHVLKSFLTSLNSENNWILRIPALFSDWTSLGAELADHKIFMGLNYFEVWGKGGFGDKPEDVAYVLDKARWLLTIDYQLAYCFILSYRTLSHHLANSEIDIFIENTLVLFARSPANAFNFLQLKTKTAKLYATSIAKEVRLSDISNRLTSLGRGISGFDLDISDFSGLDSDDLIERGSSVVCLNKFLYLPAKVSVFKSRPENLERFILLTVVAASSLYFKSFPAMHGNTGANTSLDYIRHLRINEDIYVNNFSTVVEIFRILRNIMDTFPGINGLVKQAIEFETAEYGPESATGKMMSTAINSLTGTSSAIGEEQQKLLKIMTEISDQSECFDETLKQIEEILHHKRHAGLIKNNFRDELRPLTFFPDFMFPASMSQAPDSALGADLKNQDRKPEDQENEPPSENQELSSNKTADPEKDSKKNKETSKEIIPVGFFYNEWNQLLSDYFENWCCLQEKTVPASRHCLLNEEYQQLSRQVKKVFEKLKPDLVRKEKYLPEGDNINIDMLVDYLSLHKASAFAKVKFYEKPFIRKRDLTVSVLIDMSGSTGEEVEKSKKVIDLEKASAYILGEGLAAIGDAFGIFGFSGNGRENAEYFVFKDFEDDWNEQARDSLFSATPKSSTRIGVALRHTGYKLQSRPSRKKLIILITDGKPMDSYYENSTRYAQYDVRKANEENYRNGIDSFCISTEENKIEDLEIMFPFHRYVIIKTMTELPKVLSQFYLKITK